MNITEAIDALRPFTAKVPKQALDYVRGHWDEAEPVLLAEIEKKLEAPDVEERDALFLYAIHLCTEMRCVKAFPGLVKIARLPNLLLDETLGDILTETFPQMLARTCEGRLDDIKALVEDSTLDGFTRGSAMRALNILVAEEALKPSAYAEYCLELLREKLERRTSNVWDTVVDAACLVKAPGALPLIEAAFERDLTDPSMAGLPYYIKKHNRSETVTPESLQNHVRPFRSTEAAMAFFVNGWDKEYDDTPDLLKILEDRKQHDSIQPGSQPSIGRNEPCPCGSGKKYKKCCLHKTSTVTPPVVSVHGNPVANEHSRANDWMEAGYRHQRRGSHSQAFDCWRNCWSELQNILPASLRNPVKAESTGAFEGHDFLANWLQDFENFLVELILHSFTAAKYGAAYLEAVLERFPDMPLEMKLNMQADLARCLAMLGKPEEAVASLEDMVRRHPEEAKGYVELADHYCFDAVRFNRRIDIRKARGYLESALQHAKDCLDFDVELLLEDLDDMETAMNRPLQ